MRIYPENTRQPSGFAQSARLRGGCELRVGGRAAAGDTPRKLNMNLIYGYLKSQFGFGTMPRIRLVFAVISVRAALSAASGICRSLFHAHIPTNRGLPTLQSILARTAVASAIRPAGAARRNPLVSGKAGHQGRRSGRGAGRLLALLAALCAAVAILGTAASAQTITSLSETTGLVGDLVTITGTGFANVSNVTFGGVNAYSFTVNSTTSISTIVPSAGVSGPVDVITSSGTAVGPTFTYAMPTIASFTPTYGPVGTSVTITGTNNMGIESIWARTF
jgi:hypothetical protein